VRKILETSSQLKVNEISVDVIRKAIKNLHLSVLPPDGRVRVSAPLHISDERVKAAIVSRLAWIKKQQQKFAIQPRQSQREMVTGEAHYFEGKCYRLEVIERTGQHEVALKNSSKLQLFVHPNTTLLNRQKVINEWYRQQLKKNLPSIITKYESLMEVEVREFGIKKMKTRWGTCNPKAKRIWLNLELAKKSSACLQFIVIHEMAHLIERKHNERFKKLMDKFMPNWRLVREELNHQPVRNENWDY